MSKETRLLKERMARSLAKKAWKDALEACLKLRELEPEDERILLRLGEVHERLGNKKEAVQVFKEVVDLHANDGRLARAISVAKRITALDPQDESAQKKLALLYSAKGLPAAPRSLVSEAERRPVQPQPVRVQKNEVAEPQAAPEPARPEPAWAGRAAAESRQPQQQNSGDSAGIDLLAGGERAAAFVESEEERLRRRLGSAELAEIDLSELDLAFVELDSSHGPQMPPTPLFSDLAPEELHELMHHLEPGRFGPGEVIVRQGERGDSIFVLCDGRVRVCVERPDGQQVEVATLEEGSFFGEFGVFTDGLRHATVVADQAVELLEMRQSDLARVEERHPRVHEVLALYYRHRAVETALAVSEVFGSLGCEDRREVARMAIEEIHEAGSVVIREGDEGSGLYLVRRGRLEVRTEALSGELVLLAELGPGDFFGEVSALTGAPATANVVACETCELLKLPRPIILQLCEGWPELRRSLERAKDSRLHETIERLGEAGTI